MIAGTLVLAGCGGGGSDDPPMTDMDAEKAAIELKAKQDERHGDHGRRGDGFN